MSVVFLCGRDELDKERDGYARAFERRMHVAFVPPQDGDAWIETVRALHPVVVIHPDGRWWIPEGIETIELPTAAFHIDTFSGTSRRVRTAALYDHVFLFHPGFDARFAHPGAHLLPHAADASMLSDPGRPRHFDVGWVGHRGRAIYKRRDAVLQSLATRFRMNDADRFYTRDEMAALYGDSRIVVNVSRDDWPQDANMRCFEAMAAGALLVTRVPTELSAFGFAEGIHFAGYQDGDEVAPVVERLLADDEGRLAIARRGHELVRRAHTYDARVQTILEAVERGGNAPARAWPSVRAWQRHFEAHVEQGDVRGSFRWLARIARASSAAAAVSAPRLIRLAAKVVRRSVRVPRERVF